jgi:glutathione peroxidase
MIQLILAFLMMLNTPLNDTKTVHDFTIQTITGETLDLSVYKDNVLLIVNTASECGFTAQYKDLQEVYEQYSSKGLVVIGFPANNFGGQEPGTEEDILEFCERNFGVTFPLSSKVSVKGDDKDELFQFLTSASNPDFDGDINWNFEKFLIDQNGHLIRRFRSRTSPTSTEVKASIEALLTR